MSSHEHVLLAAVGMSACFGAMVRAPLTGLLIVFEMTHQFALVPALMLGTIISQAVARLTSHENFYDALLRQDGHELMKVRPPRDLAAWQNLPVSDVANRQPVVIDDLSPDRLRQVLEAHPYQCFPVVLAGELRGAVTRAEVMDSLQDGRAPVLEKLATVHPDDKLIVAETQFVDSPTGILVLQDGATGGIVGLITLHDLLRLQVAMAE